MNHSSESGYPEYTQKNFHRVITEWIRQGGSPDARYPKGGDHAWTLLHIAAEYRDLEAIKLLVASGANLNLQDDQGWTPLHLAVDSDCDTSSQQGRRPIELPTVKALINLGADESIRSKDGETARDIATGYHETRLYDSVSHLNRVAKNGE